MPKISLEALEARRNKVEREVASLVEDDINAVLAGQSIAHSATIANYGQDLNILSAAIERHRNAG
ncbi:hypothetical protein [Pararhizobium sp. DWP3-4]|uniref:hypothetical protein n=1 Tax=Pararhizobium sp. DWP3-4 TaxID=2804565 RepID=UPI003CE920E2